MLKQIKIFLLIVMVFSSMLYSKTIHVPKDITTIQEAIDQAETGDTVLVAPGAYKENINFHGKNITVASHFLINKDPRFIKDTVIDGSRPEHPDKASCVSFLSGEDSNAVLQGFTLINGAGTIRIEPNGTSWREGGGIMILGSSPTIKNNLITKNRVMNTTNVTSTGGGGISCAEGNPKILNNIIMLNQARYAAGIMLYHSGVELMNNIICQNSGGQDYGGGGIVMEGKGPGPKIMENNIIVANAAFGDGFYGGRAGGLLAFKTSVLARNNIIWGNIQNNGGQIYIHHQLTQADFTYNNIEGGWEGEGNTNILPVFSKTNFGLSDKSPRIEMEIPDMLIPATPYSGIPFQIPGKIEAEAFDWSTEDKAFFDGDTINQGGAYRSEGVDIETCNDFGGGYYLSHIQKGEWLTYTVNIIASEKYDLAVRVASEENSGRFHLECDGRDLTGSIQIPNTGGMQKWQRITVPDLELPTGKHVLRFVCENSGFCLNSFHFSVGSSTLPEEWQNQDIGDVREAGSAGVINGTFYIEGSGKASGHTYYNEDDELHFVYQKLSGDMEIIARIQTQTYTHEWGKAGVMIREALDNKSKYASVAVTLMASPVLYRRVETGERSDLHGWLVRTDYNWLKLTRIGNMFTGYKSKDGVNWVELEEKEDISMTDEVYVGLAITSHDDGIVSSATFDNVIVRQMR